MEISGGGGDGQPLCDLKLASPHIRRRVKMKRTRVECTCSVCLPERDLLRNHLEDEENRWHGNESKISLRKQDHPLGVLDIYDDDDDDDDDGKDDNQESDPCRTSTDAHKPTATTTTTTTCHTSWTTSTGHTHLGSSVPTCQQTKGSSATRAKDMAHHERYAWPRWPHGKPTRRDKTTSACLNNYKFSQITSSILLSFVTTITLSVLMCVCADAYQLTNNLIANNLPPKFVAASTTAGATTASQTNSEIVVRVKEGPQSIGKLIYTLKGEDPDEDPLTFGVLGTMASDLLRIENSPGNQANVYLRKELDRETTESHQVVITLTDGKLGRGNWITKSMLIIVEDVNDNYPVFGPHRTAISVREDARAPLVIETLEATDADEGRFGQVIYKLDDQTTTGGYGGLDSVETGTGGVLIGGSARAERAQMSDMFAIETIDGRGVISLIGQLDYEQRPLYQLRILAIDRAHENERLSTSTSILISVEDCEDQPPMFTFAPSITRIPEDTPIGSPVVRVSAIDGDRGVNAPIKYSIVTVNGHEAGYERNLFTIGSDSGQITVAHELDRELSLSTPTRTGTQQQPGAYVIQVRATEVAGDTSQVSHAAASSVTTELTILLIDVNDELPSFDQPEYLGELLENSPAESLVTFVRTQSKGGREQVAPGSGTHTNSGDNFAQLTQQQLVVGAKVTDRDQGTNGTFTLHLEGEHGHLFEVWPAEATNEANLMIKVAPTLQSNSNKFFDYERTKELRLTLVAREKYATGTSSTSGSERSTTAEMVIKLRDANDNYPQFDSELYMVEIPENAIRGMHICAVKALDADSGPLGSAGVRYTEIRGERANKFKLDPVTGVITLRTNEHGFDRESVAQHHLIVEARDNLGTGNRNTTQLLIVLTDVNDQRPKFALDQYETFIYENELDFQSPLQVQAHDSDAAGTQNSQITYSIVAGDPQGNFTIDPLTGRIRVRTSLVMAGAGLPMATSNLRALATSSGDQLEPPTGGLDFERIAQKRDDTRMFNLTVRAQDAGSPEPLASTAQVIVLVYDKNDNAPMFTRPVYAKSVREDLPGGSPVIQVQAVDGDHSPTNSRITYRIGTGGSDKFVIDSDSGLISIANGANLDIDRVQGGGQRRISYLLSVLAYDGSFGQNQKSASCLVNISIIDVNNKAPEFVSLGASYLNQAPVSSLAGTQTGGPQSGRTQLGLPNQVGGAIQQQVGVTSSHLGGQQQQVFVNEDAPYGLIVTRVFATDLDSSAELRYSINYARSEARNEDMALVEPTLYRDVFAIDPTEGIIKVNKQLDRELFDQIKLRLQVEDLAAQTAEQVAHTYLVIRITDVNDNRPSFKQPLYKAVVNENSISGTQVITMSADDRDLNKTLRYSLEASTPEVARLVRINPRSGEVTVNDKIDRELHPLINVTIKAEDFGQPVSLTGNAQLVITVRDENDNNPIFLNATHLRPGAHHLSAREQFAPRSAGSETPVNHNNNHLSGGGGGGGVSSYRLRSLGPPHLGASSSGGSRYLGEDQPPVLDMSEEQFAAGASRPPASFVGVPDTPRPHDENGNELPLLAPGASAQVREDAPVGHQIAYVRAEDADLGNNGRVTYLLDASSSGGGKFRIDRDTGILSVAQPLDREQQSHYTLIIEACDNFDLGYSTGESRRAFTQVAIQVADINDNPPTIGTNLHLTTTNKQHHHHSQHVPSSWPSSSGAGLMSTGTSQISRPTYEEAMNSPGPYEMPLAECLFIDEFQPLNEPILTITATDPDDPELPNGQIDLALINNLPQNEMFALMAIRVGDRSTSSNALIHRDLSLPTTTSSPKSSDSGADVESTSVRDDLSGFGEHARRRRRRRSAETKFTESQLSPQPGTFYGRSQTGSRASISPTTTTTTNAPQQQQQMAQVQTIVGGEHQMHLVVRQSLRERVGNYSILVRATDRGQPALSSAKLVNICVLDVNNHAPVFKRPALNQTIRIMENATVGSYVTQVEASDQDHGLNGELAYSLKPTGNIHSSSNTDWQSFKIDRVSGVISTTKLFNRQVKKYYTLRVQAQDFGRPTSLSSDIDINIMIVNSGKYQPEFEQQTQVLMFTENLAPGLEWFKLLQTTNLDDDPALIMVDQDKRATSQSGPTADNWLSSPCYFIVDTDDHDQLFHLDRYTHRLTNQRELDREQGANYTLLVQASNNCQPRAPTGGWVSRHLTPPPPPPQPREVVPTAGDRDQEVSLTTTTTTGSTLGVNELAISSISTGTNERVARSASGGGDGGGGGGGGGGVSIRRADSTNETLVPVSGVEPAQLTGFPHSGPVVAAQASWAASLDTMLANDKSLLKVVIRVRDVNDNAPKFTQKIYTGGITTEADFGTVFMIVQATDADADANGQVTYSLIKPIKRQLSLMGGGGGGAGSLSGGFLDSDGLTHSVSLRQKRQVAPTEAFKPSQPPPPLTIVSGHEQSELVVATTNIQHNSAGQSISPTLADTDELFLVHPQTGEISLNFDPQKHMKGYFEFEIIARDPDGLSDTARVLIYLLRQDQRVKFVLRLTPQELRQRLNKFRSVFGNITGAIVNIDSYKYYENHDGTVDKKKTSLFLHFVQPEDNTIIEVDKVLTLIDNNIEYLDELYKEFHVLSSEATHVPLGVGGALVDPIDQVRTGLMGVSSFLALILILVIALCLNQRTRYERQLKAATVSAFGSSPLHLDPDFHTQTNLPNTNLHSQDPNPIWINGHYGAGETGVGGGGGGAGNQDLAGNHEALMWTSTTRGGADSHQPSAMGKSRSRDEANHKKIPHKKLFNSSSSGVGMALDDDELERSDDDDDEDQLSTSGGRSDELNSSDLNSLSGEGGRGPGAVNHNHVQDHHHHHHHHQYNATSATTATPGDSLASSHGQVSPPSSSSGSNSASTTNERQALCLSGGRAGKQQKAGINQQHQLTVAQSNINVKPSSGSGANSTFGGAFKEVTIYTETARHQQQSQKSANCNNNGKPVSRTTNNQQQQQQSSHVNRLASQFNAAKLHQQNQSIYVPAQQQQQQQQQQRPMVAQVNHNQNRKPSNQSHILVVHSNGADVNKGIIKTAPESQIKATTKQIIHHLDAKFVPPAAVAQAVGHGNKLSNVTLQQQQQQEQSVNNFETSLSKLSILNLETTEL